MDRFRHLPNYRYYEAEGYPLSLGKTAGKPLRNYRIYGNTVDGAGVGEIGKNVFDAERWYNELYNIESSHSGTLAVSKGNDGVYDYIQTSAASNKYNAKFMQDEFKENTQYTFSFMGKFISGSGNAGITFYYKDGTNVTKWITSTNHVDWAYGEITTSANKTLSYISLNSYSPGTIFQIANIQLEEGTTVTEYEPYSLAIPIAVNGDVVKVPINEPLTEGKSLDFKADGLPEIRTKKHQNNIIEAQTTVPPSNIWCQYYK